MKHLSTALLISALAALPLAIWIEHTDLKTWNDRLVIPELEPEPNRHTPRHAEGTFVPPVIANNLELTADHNPVLLTGVIKINPGVTVTIHENTALYAHEFAQLIVAGELRIRGTKRGPVTLTSNEVHPLNQVWGGIVVQPTGQATIAHATIRHASPALTCEANSQVTVDAALIEQSALGVFTASQSCSIKNSRIKSTQDGVVAHAVEAELINTRMTVGEKPVRHIDK